MRGSICALTALLLVPFSAAAQKLVVHEWGTFTTMQGSDGGPLSGLYLEEEELPVFVHSHGGFSPQPATYSGKGYYRELRTVRVKMETPVLYFYAPEETAVNVRVNFPAGSISQWYPHRSAGEMSPDIGSTLDFTKPFNGWIQWNATVLPPDSKAVPTPKDSLVTHTWRAPRATDANMVRGSTGEQEGFLFYRGIGNFPVPLSARFDANGDLELGNNGGDPIPFVLVYDKPKSGPARIVWSGDLAAAEHHVVAMATIGEPSGEPDFTAFEDALVNAGLYRKEAAAMLNTWRTSYFDRSGLRIFWIVPRAFTDATLPLSMTPAPDSLERVLVGRSEVMTPTFEAMIYQDFSAGRDSLWRNDRYYLAYRERYSRMRALLSADDHSSHADAASISEPILYPNPAHASFTLVLPASATGATIDVVDAAGAERLRLPAAVGASCRAEIDLADLPDGVYYVRIRSSKEQWLRMVVKQ